MFQRFLDEDSQILHYFSNTDPPSWSSPEVAPTLLQYMDYRSSWGALNEDQMNQAQTLWLLKTPDSSTRLFSDCGKWRLPPWRETSRSSSPSVQCCRTRRPSFRRGSLSFTRRRTSANRIMALLHMICRLWLGIVLKWSGMLQTLQLWKFRISDLSM